MALFQDSLRVTSNLRRRTYSRNALDSVTWARGCGVSIKPRSGGWLNLPDIGNVQSISNTIRAWLKRTS